jgi:apolipoprotein N-acyltransferase
VFRRAPVLAGLAIAASGLLIELYSRIAWPWLVLGWVAFVPWMIALDRTRSLRGALASGLLMAAAMELAVVGWFAAGIAGYTGGSWALATLVLVAGAPLFQPQVVAFALARHLTRSAVPAVRWRAALVAAGVYAGTEWAVPKFLTDTLGYGLYPSVWLRQGADLVGAPGLVFALVLGNECVLALGVALGAPGRGVRRALAPAGGLAAILAVLLGYGAFRTQQLTATVTPGSAVTVGAVQTNLSHYDDLRTTLGSYEAVRRILDTHFALSTTLLRQHDLDLLIWSETVYPTTFDHPKSDVGADFDREITAFAATAGVPLIFGSYDTDGTDEFNAAFVLTPSRDDDASPTLDVYRKAIPFPLTERVPALLESDLARRWWPWLGTWKAGDGPKVIPVALADGRTVHVAPLICYDALAPALVQDAVRNGAELIVTLSNDSWFAGGKGPRLHLVGAIFRSLETRRPQVRVTNTGISAVITATGDLVAIGPVGARALLAAPVVPDGATTTLLVAWGNWFGPTVLAGSLGLFVLTRRRRRTAGR